MQENNKQIEIFETFTDKYNIKYKYSNNANDDEF